jgi:hypothetical protein
VQLQYMVLEEWRVACRLRHLTCYRCICNDDSTFEQEWRSGNVMARNAFHTHSMIPIVGLGVVQS